MTVRCVIYVLVVLVAAGKFDPEINVTLLLTGKSNAPLDFLCKNLDF
jgi:hypothetical protein